MGKVIHHLTIDWVRKTNRVRDEFTRLAEKNTSSMSDPILPEGKTSLEDVLAADCPETDDLETSIETALNSLKGLKDRYRIILQASIMFFCPLSVDDIRAIAESRGISVKQVQEEEEAIMKDLDRRFMKATREKLSAYNLYARVRHLEFKLYTLQQDAEADPKAIRSLMREISEKSKRRDEQLAKYLRPIRPSTQQLAAFLGMPETNVATINTLLHRARKMLIGKRACVTN
jgi:hypothetical protein